MTDIEIPWISLCDNNFSLSIIKSQHSLYLEDTMTWITPVIKFKSRARCFACSVGLDESISIANMSQTAIRIPQFVEGGKSFYYNFFFVLNCFCTNLTLILHFMLLWKPLKPTSEGKSCAPKRWCNCGWLQRQQKTLKLFKTRKHNIMYHIIFSKK